MKTLLKLGPIYQDGRGNIQMILENEKISSVSVIHSLTGSTRAGHWHKKDSHFCYVAFGTIEYYERPVGSKSKPKKTIIKTGELFYTPPNAEHEMYFPEETIFHCYSTLSRTSKNYEADTTRLPASLKQIYESTPF